MADDFRKQVGVILRFPVAVILGMIWLIYFWWWVAGIIIVFSLLGLVLQPVIYPVVWLCSAFANSDDSELLHYWDNYPAKYSDAMGNALQLGFRALAKWTLEGFDKS